MGGAPTLLARKIATAKKEVAQARGPEGETSFSCLVRYSENSSDAFRRLRQRGKAPEKLAVSPQF